MSLLNVGQLAALYDLAGPQMGDLLDDYARSTSEALAKLAGLVAGEEAVELVHEVRGASATMGMAALEGKLGELEGRLRGGQAPNPADLQQMMILLAESIAAVTSRLADGGTGEHPGG
ncbi:MAG: hypothetical protein O3A87_10575 [Verrucomicrobia bacterium]|nr:hypothetical protein [Verrucomicrobiota bacterium]MDA1006904.1 hypothetical protein [Verrucomicrobiota bacterium]